MAAAGRQRMEIILAEEGEERELDRRYRICGLLAGYAAVRIYLASVRRTWPGRVPPVVRRADHDAAVRRGSHDIDRGGPGAVSGACHLCVKAELVDQVALGLRGGSLGA